MGTREWILTGAVIVVPLLIAIVVTLWSLEQVRYRPKRRRPVPNSEEPGQVSAPNDASRADSQ